MVFCIQRCTQEQHVGLQYCFQDKATQKKTKTEKQSMTDWLNCGEIPKHIIEQGIDILALNSTSEQKMQSVI